MNFCGHCGSPIERRIPRGDNRLREVCTACGTIHYQNPKIVAGCIAELGDRILLCRRAIEPRYGLWTLPAGFMENGETALEAAARETQEEANATVEITGLFALLNLPHVSQVYMIFRAEVIAMQGEPGPESLEVQPVDEHSIPWDRLAFPTILHALRFYYRDRRAGGFGFHMGDIIKNGDRASYVARRAFPEGLAAPVPASSHS